MADSDEIKTARRTLGRRLAELRKAAGYTQHTFAAQVMYGRSTVANVETGYQQPDKAFWHRCDEVLGTGGVLTADYDRLIALVRHRRRHRSRHVPMGNTIDAPTDAPRHNQPGQLHEEWVRQRVEQTLGHSDVAPGGLDDWEATIAAQARATRYRPAHDLVVELLASMDDLRVLLHRRHTSSTLRRTTVFAARMAGLVSLTLLKTNAFAASRRWGRTARAAAAEAGDPATSSWVWAQEAYRHFYAGSFLDAVTVARHAQDLSGTAGGVGAVLAAAVEGRAHAAVGDAEQTRRALQRAEDILGRLAPTETTASAFGYDEAQLRFHAGNAFTYLGDINAAFTAQQRALHLYPAEDYLDRALVGLDRAACVIRAGDIHEGAHQLVAVLNSLPPDQRDELLLTRARHIVETVPAARRADPRLGEVHDLLAVCASPDKEPAR